MSRVERVYLSARAHVHIRHQGLVAKTAMDWTQRLNPVTRRSAHVSYYIFRLYFVKRHLENRLHLLGRHNAAIEVDGME